ncbi:MAG: cytochrome b [Amaricoccus sp.]|uniref:cytochrome b n=1 Tax=Amaricoccus sp. TaxID=1872485 RepID=UPI003315531A
MGYDVVSRLLHWVTVLIVFVMIPVGLYMTQDGIPRATQDGLFKLHKGLGSIFLLVILARLAWRLFHRPPPLPASIAPAQRWAAEAVHAGLYVFLLVMAVSGYVRVTTGGFPIEWLNAIGIPPLLPKAEAVSKVASIVHAVAKNGLILLILMHVGAAAYHGIVRRDGVMSRMWPPV